MPRLFIVIILAFVLFFFVTNSKPLVLGMADNTFVSPKRPSFAFKPTDNKMRLVKAHKVNIFPEVQDDLVSVNNVMAYYAYYKQVTNNTPDKSLVCILALNDDERFAWLIDNKSEFLEQHKKNKSFDGQDIELVSFVLPAHEDPYYEAEENTKDFLVRRYTLFAFQRKAKIIIEYREAQHLSEQGLDIFVDPKANADFEKRADEAFIIMFKDLPEVKSAFTFDDDMARRNELSKYLGKTMYTGKS